MDDSLKNPFTQSRVSVATTSSLLTYGDNNLSFFNRLQTNNSRLQRSMSFASQQEVEERIIGMFQKEMYTMDQSGRCLAELAIDQMITQDEEKKQDFWDKIKSSKPKKEIRNPFTTDNAGPTKQTIVQTTTKKPKLGTAKNISEETNKTKRHSARLQMIRLKDIIKKQKQKEQKRQAKPERFSLVSMYKAKRQSFQPISTILTFANPNLQTRTSLSFLHPQAIKVKGIQYYLIPLTD